MMNLNNIDKKTIFFVFIIIILIFSNLLTVSRCSTEKHTNEVNLDALTDTIKYFESKNGSLVAQKTMLNGNLSTLQKVNDSLYNVIKGMGVSSPDNVVYSKITIHDTKHDTAWITQHDTIDEKFKNIYNINKKFNFSDSYRMLAGTTWFHSNGLVDSLGMTIDTNTVVADFTVVQKDNNIFITSNNPYIEYNKVIGLTSTKKKRFSIGPVVGVGINQKAKFTGFAGVGLMYNVFSF
jgi:hypothetical protein